MKKEYLFPRIFCAILFATALPTVLFAAPQPDDDIHQFFVGLAFGNAQISPANIKEKTDLVLPNYLYNSLTTGSSSPPTLQMPEETSSAGFSIFKFEYRYKDNLRFYLRTEKQNRASFAALTQYPETSLFLASSSSGTYEFSGRDAETGAAYLFSLGKNFKIGPGIAQRSITQTFQEKTFESAVTKIAPVFTSGTEWDITAQHEFNGAVPFLLMEWRPVGWLSADYRLSYVRLAGNFSTAGVGNVRGTIDTGGFFPEFFNGIATQNYSGGAKLKGSTHEFRLLFHIASWMDLNLGFVGESYKRTIDSYIGNGLISVGTASISYVSVGILEPLYEYRHSVRKVYLETQFKF